MGFSSLTTSSTVCALPSYIQYCHITISGVNSIPYLHYKDYKYCSQLSHVEYCDYIFFLGQLVFLELIIASLFSICLVFYDFFLFFLLMHPQFLHQSCKIHATHYISHYFHPFLGDLHLTPVWASCWRLGLQVLGFQVLSRHLFCIPNSMWSPKGNTQIRHSPCPQGAYRLKDV